MVDDEQLPALDRERALARVGGDEDLLREIGSLFLEECSPALHKLRSAVAARDCGGIERGAHSLKGSIATFGTGFAFQAAFDLEQQGRSGNLARVESNLARVESSVARLCTELRTLVSQ